MLYYFSAVYRTPCGRLSYVNGVSRPDPWRPDYYTSAREKFTDRIATDTRRKVASTIKITHSEVIGD